jgi:preprotein translocase subunit SecY
VIATTALLWLVLVREPAAHRPLLWVWNACGLIDIVFVVATAARIAAADPASMGPLRHLPLSLLPTFLVPLIIASHVLIFWRLRAGSHPEA